MSRLSRFTQYLFGSSASGSRIAVFGSLAAGSPTAYSGATVTPAEIQAESASFASGWDSALIGNNSPAVQDQNALDYLTFYQLCYLYQQGVPEYDGSTQYYSNSIVMNGSTGILYQAGASVLGSAPPSSNWNILADQLFSQRSSTTGYTVGIGGVAVSPSSGSFASSGSGSVTNLSVTITTSGRAVQLLLQPDGSGSPANISANGAVTSETIFLVNKGASTIFNTALTGNNTIPYLPPSIISAVDTSVIGSPGTYTYSIRAAVISGQILVSNAVLVAYEL